MIPIPRTIRPKDRRCSRCGTWHHWMRCSQTPRGCKHCGDGNVCCMMSRGEATWWKIHDCRDLDTKIPMRICVEPRDGGNVLTLEILAGVKVLDPEDLSNHLGA